MNIKIVQHEENYFSRKKHTETKVFLRNCSKWCLSNSRHKFHLERKLSWIVKARCLLSRFRSVQSASITWFSIVPKWKTWAQSNLRSGERGGNKRMVHYLPSSSPQTVKLKNRSRILCCGKSTILLIKPFRCSSSGEFSGTVTTTFCKEYI